MESRKRQAKDTKGRKTDHRAPRVKTDPRAVNLCHTTWQKARGNAKEMAHGEDATFRHAAKPVTRHSVSRLVACPVPRDIGGRCRHPLSEAVCALAVVEIRVPSAEKMRLAGEFGRAKEKALHSERALGLKRVA